MGTPHFAVPSLLALLKSRHTVVAALSQPDKPAGRGLSVTPTPVKAAALAHGVEAISAKAVKTEGFLRRVTSLEPDVLAVVAFGRILPETILTAPPHGAVNLHASLLPKYRGAAPAAWAIARGESVTGVTTMKIAAELDAGDVLLQRSLAIQPDETAGGLQEKLAELGAPLLVETLDALEEGSLAGLPQDHAAATFAPILKKEDGLIDWALPAEEIERRVRAFDPWPGAFTSSQGKSMRIWRARVAAHPAPSRRPGEIEAASKEGLLVACGGGTALEILEVQPEGKRRMPAAAAVAGRYFAEGAALGSARPPSA